MPRRVEVTARPTDGFHVENSDGYALYSSLLARMQDADEETSAGYVSESENPKKETIPRIRWNLHSGVKS
jgi:hypothetical protein